MRAGDDNRYELLNGRIVLNPPAGWPYGEGEADALGPIQQFVRRRELGRVFGPSQGFDLRGERYDLGSVFEAGDTFASEVLVDLRAPVEDLLPRP